MLARYRCRNSGNSVCLSASVCPSVRRALCDKTKECTADILIQHERAITLVFDLNSGCLAMLPSV